MTKAKKSGRVTYTHRVFTKIINRIELNKAKRIALLSIEKDSNIVPVINTG